MKFEITDPIIDRGVEALFGQHPERGGQERRQAVFSVLTAVFDNLTHKEAVAMADEFFSAFLVLDLKGVRLARAADIVTVLGDEDSPLPIVQIGRPHIMREIQINLTFTEASVPQWPSST